MYDHKVINLREKTPTFVVQLYENKVPNSQEKKHLNLQA